MSAYVWMHTDIVIRFKFTFINYSERYRQAEHGGSYKYSENMGVGYGKIRSLDYPWLCMKFEVG